jgi:hypothetical protein
VLQILLDIIDPAAQRLEFRSCGRQFPKLLSVRLSPVLVIIGVCWLFVLLKDVREHKTSSATL